MKSPLSASFMVGVMAAAFWVWSPAAGAATIIDEWGSVKAEPAPALAPVTVDVKTTAPDRHGYRSRGRATTKGGRVAWPQSPQSPSC